MRMSCEKGVETINVTDEVPPTIKSTSYLLMTLIYKRMKQDLAVFTRWLALLLFISYVRGSEFVRFYLNIMMIRGSDYFQKAREHIATRMQ